MTDMSVACVRITRSLVPTVGFLLSACGNPKDPVADLPPVLSVAIVSDPTVAPARPHDSLGANRSTETGPAGEVAYVSLRPGSITISTLGAATIRNVRMDTVVSLSIAAGGFDPVAVPASGGDTLRLEIEVTGSGTDLAYSLFVPHEHRPEIVRTDPVPGQRDVELHTWPLVVFSEPMDSSVLTASAIGLAADQTPVPHQGEFRDPEQLTVAVVPGAMLTPSTRHWLTVEGQAQDLDGQLLERPAAVDFLTEAPLPIGIIALEASDVIYVMNADGTMFTPVGASYQRPVLSPDGTRIAVEAGGSIYLTDVAGTSVSRLVTGSFPVWSPDGTRLAFGSQVINADGTGLVTLGAASYPSWSPDGTKLVLTDLTDLFIADADGSSFTTVRPGRIPSWSPAGPKIRFCTVDREASPPVLTWVMSPDGSNASVINERDAGCGPVWSPAGDWFAYSYGRGIYTMRSDGTDVTRLSPPGGLMDRMPAWSPDARHIAFVSDRGDLNSRRAFGLTVPAELTCTGCGNYDVYVMRVDGTRLTRLTALGDVSWLSWSKGRLPLRSP